ncbi:MAG TPA: DMT family transporter [Gordonibacter urolithinfaciens]|uniref:DMT family transporter n=1 Tax=Gordonibacter urolithinfaciens TaxID=1335613 RepID=UPI001DBCF1B2|nr:DMT family transporter [Gordonibacter urolithinfaciens]HJF61861.1 DMT family transporter [Gordonibacter urolithinfaciens]
MEKLDGIAHRIPTGVYKLLLVVATVIWGLSFVVMKDAVDVLQPAYLIGFRFLATGAILAALFFRRLRAALSGERALDYLVKGTILGVVCYLAFWVQTIGLDHTTPGKNAFLTATYCVIVPFAWWAIARKRPTAFNLVAAVMAVGGIGLMSLTGSLSELTMGFGDTMTLVSALLFAVHIVYVSKFSEKSDVLVLTLLQFAVGGVCGVAYGACFETLPPAESLTPAFWMNMAYLVVFASCVAFVIQNVALAHVPPAQASLFLSLESVFGVLFSVLLYGEEIGLRLVGGFALIFVAIVVSETFPLKSKAGDDAPALALETPGGPVVSPEPLGVLGARDADGRAAVESTQEEASWSKNGTT